VNKNGRIFRSSICRTVLIVSGICLFNISCEKEISYEGTTPAEAISVFTTQTPSGLTENDKISGIELGMRFRSAIAGSVEGVKFYKTPGNTGIHTVQLYSFEGTLLASAVFTNETDSGWQTVLFDSVVAINANTTYITAYFSSLGNYISTANGFNTAISNPPLTGLADGADGLNGLYRYSNSPSFPSVGFQANNYWVDVLVSVHPDQ
jgi:hypothetical protein